MSVRECAQARIPSLEYASGPRFPPVFLRGMEGPRAPLSTFQKEYSSSAQMINHWLSGVNFTATLSPLAKSRTNSPVFRFQRRPPLLYHADAASHFPSGLRLT